MSAHPSPFSIPTTTPQFLTEAEKLHTILAKKTPEALQKIMHISPTLAQATHERITAWKAEDGTPAWYTFVGDVYKGLKIEQFVEQDLAFAQKHMGTISGLYGIVRPLDLIHPYRLELMYKLSGKGFRNLYEFWSDRIANIIPEDEPVINLASEEYIKVLRPYLPKEQIITPWFMQLKDGKPVFQAIHAKIARGTMARWIAKNQINQVIGLKKFDLNGYTYLEDLSTPTKPVFIRPENYDFRSDY